MTVVSPAPTTATTGATSAVMTAATTATAHAGAKHADPPPSALTPLAFTGVSHWYGDIVAVNNITCTVTAGITGLLGPNGAGKSTLLQLGAGLLAPSNGSVHVYGDTPTDNPAIFMRVALVPEREAMPSTMTARAFVRARAQLLGIADAAGATRRALEIVELDTAADRAVGGFSKGMRQRVKLAAALVHEPTLVLLDEPFNGLDPRQRLHMMRLLEARASEGTAVLLSSHILEEIEGVAANILVVLAGRLAASGDYRTLRRMMTDRPHTVRVRSSDDRALAASLIAMPSVIGIEVTTRGIVVSASDYSTFAASLAGIAQRASVSLYEVQPTDESLEHVFTYLVGR